MVFDLDEGHIPGALGPGVRDHAGPLPAGLPEALSPIVPPSPLVLFFLLSWEGAQSLGTQGRRPLLSCTRPQPFLLGHRRVPLLGP